MARMFGDPGGDLGAARKRAHEHLRAQAADRVARSLGGPMRRDDFPARHSNSLLPPRRTPMDIIRQYAQQNEGLLRREEGGGGGGRFLGNLGGDEVSSFPGGAHSNFLQPLGGGGRFPGEFQPAAFPGEFQPASPPLGGIHGFGPDGVVTSSGVDPRSHRIDPVGGPIFHPGSPQRATSPFIPAQGMQPSPFVPHEVGPERASTQFLSPGFNPGGFRQSSPFLPSGLVHLGQGLFLHPVTGEIHGLGPQVPEPQVRANTLGPR